MEAFYVFSIHLVVLFITFLQKIVMKQMNKQIKYKRLLMLHTELLMLQR